MNDEKTYQNESKTIQYDIYNERYRSVSFTISSTCQTTVSDYSVSDIYCTLKINEAKCSLHHHSWNESISIQYDIQSL